MRIILLGIAPIKYPDIPLTFVRSGAVSIIVSLVNVTNIVGQGGYYWSRTANPAYTYNLSILTTNVVPSANGNRDFGRPLRCLYPGSA